MKPPHCRADGERFGFRRRFRSPVISIPDFRRELRVEISTLDTVE